MNLPIPGPTYDGSNEAQARAEMQRADKQNRKVTQNVEIGGQMLILRSPDGTRWNATVSDAGAWVLTAL